MVPEFLLFFSNQNKHESQANKIKLKKCNYKFIALPNQYPTPPWWGQAKLLDLNCWTLSLVYYTLKRDAKNVIFYERSFGLLF